MTESVALARAFNNGMAIAFDGFLLGQVETGRGNYARADAYLDEAIQLSRESGGSIEHIPSLGLALHDLALWQRSRGDEAGAAASLQEALELSVRMGDELLRRACLDSLIVWPIHRTF